MRDGCWDVRGSRLAWGIPLRCAEHAPFRQRRRNSATILYRGHTVDVSIVRDPSIKRRGIVENIGRTLRVRIPACGTMDPAPVLEKWLRKRAREAICGIVTERSKKIRRKPGRIFIMDQRTRWGGCSRRGNLSFNWRLIMAPPSVLEYVVTHELVHLAVPNHSGRFWLTLRSIFPSYEKEKAWLRDYQGKLRSAPPLKRCRAAHVGRLPPCLPFGPLI